MRRGNVLMAFFMALTLGVAGAGGAAAAPLYHDGYGRASLEVDVGVFYQDLDPYGQWVEYRDYGWVFVPRVSHGWRPYTVGHWVWTDDYGWLWVSDEKFGWATCHYGRWTPDPSYGWIWVPGYEWGPAWVSWRSGGGYIGWAPLPPRVAFDASFGFRAGAAEIDAFIAPQQYVFVEERVFVDPAVHRHFVRADRNTVIIRETRNVTNYRVSGGRVINRSVDPDEVQRVSGRRVPRARPVEVDSVKVAHQARLKGDEVPVFRPNVRPKADAKPPHGKAAARRENGPGRGDVSGRPVVGNQREQNQRSEAEKLARQRQDQVRQQQRLDKQRQADQREAEKRLARSREQREQQRRDLDKRQARQREVLEKQHKQEIKHPPREVAAQELERRQAEQHRMMDERQHRERQQMEAQRQQARHEHEQQQRRSADNRAEQKPKQKPKDKPKDKPDHQ